MKKILFIQHCSSIGGASWSLLEILKSLNRNKFDPTVILLEEGTLEDAIQALGIPVLINTHLSIINPLQPLRGGLRHNIELMGELFWLPRCFDSFQKLCADLNPDIVYLNSSALFALAYPAKRAGIEKVVLHNREHWYGKGFLGLKEKLKNRIVDKAIDHVFSITECGIEQFGFSGKSTVVPDWPSFDDKKILNVRKDLGIAPGQFLILVPGGLHRIKGTLDVLKALRYMKKSDQVSVVVLGCESHPISKLKEIALKIVGKERYRHQVERLANSSPRVFLLPSTRQVKTYMEQCDVVVCPFLIPHAAKPALEAGSVGQPVIVYDGDEAREYVVNGETGVIVDLSDIHGLAMAFGELQCNPEKAMRLGEKARTHIKQDFSEEKSMKVLSTILCGETCPEGGSF